VSERASEREREREFTRIENHLEDGPCA
jgi:hypothetical protein